MHATRRFLGAFPAALRSAAGKAAAVTIPGLAAMILVLTPAAPPAAAATAATARPSPPGEFSSVNFETDLCLGAKGKKTKVPAVQATCTGLPDQVWHWQNQDLDFTNYYQIVNDDGQCLGVSGGSKSVGAAVVVWTCLGQTHQDQYWAPTFTGACGQPFTAIVNLKSGLVLDIANDSRLPNAAVVQMPYQFMCHTQFWGLF